jgi:hypothetical protein
MGWLVVLGVHGSSLDWDERIKLRFGIFPNQTKALCWRDGQSDSSETSVVDESKMVVQEKSEETDIRGGTHKPTRSKTEARS